MNMYRCKTAVDLCLYGNNSIIDKNPETRRVKTAVPRKKNDIGIQRPKWYRPQLPVKNGASKLIRSVFKAHKVFSRLISS